MAGELAAEWIKIPDGNGNLQKVWVRDSTARRDIAQLQSDIGSLVIPTKTSDLTNDSGFITASAVPAPSSASPAMDGTAAAGSSTDYARADHVHPTDTSILPIMGTFTGNIDDATITPGIYVLDRYSLALSSGTTYFYGTFIQFPGLYKVQMVVGGGKGAGGIIESRRYLTGSSEFTSWA